jgi:hypothetical protein
MSDYVIANDKQTVKSPTLPLETDMESTESKKLSKFDKFDMSE